MFKVPCPQTELNKKDESVLPSAKPAVLREAQTDSLARRWGSLPWDVQG